MSFLQDCAFASKDWSEILSYIHFDILFVFAVLPVQYAVTHCTTHQGGERIL